MKYSGCLICLGIVSLIAALIIGTNPLRNYSVKADKVLGVISIILVSIGALLIPAAVFCLENNM